MARNPDRPEKPGPTYKSEAKHATSAKHLVDWDWSVFKSVVLKVVDIEPQWSVGTYKGVTVDQLLTSSSHFI